MEIKLFGFKNFDIPVSPKDFFGVLLPGAIVAIVVYAVIKFGDTSWLKQLVEVIDGYWERWIAFAIVSLCLGYLLQIPASGLNPLYNCTYLAWKLRGGNKQKRTEYNSAYRLAYDIVKAHSPEKAAEIEQKQGISEFFRSLTVISIVVCAIMFWNSNFYPAAAALVFSLACYWLFCDKLWAATEVSFKIVAQISRHWTQKDSHLSGFR